MSQRSARYSSHSFHTTHTNYTSKRASGSVEVCYYFSLSLLKWFLRKWPLKQHSPSPLEIQGNPQKPLILQAQTSLKSTISLKPGYILAQNEAIYLFFPSLCCNLCFSLKSPQIQSKITHFTHKKARFLSFKLILRAAFKWPSNLYFTQHLHINNISVFSRPFSYWKLLKKTLTLTYKSIETAVCSNETTHTFTLITGPNLSNIHNFS